MKVPILVDIGILYYKAYLKLNYDVEIKHSGVLRPCMTRVLFYCQNISMFWIFLLKPLSLKTN